MRLRSHLRRSLWPFESEQQDFSIRSFELGGPHRSSSRADKAHRRRGRSAVRISRNPLRSILKFSSLRRVGSSPMAHKSSYYYDAVPQPKRKEVKKQVRFNLPDKSQSVRPAQSVSTCNADRKRSSSSHPNRSSKSSRHSEPALVAPGLSTVARTMQVDKPRELAKAKARAEQQRKRQSAPAPIVVSTPRKERRSHGGYESQSNRRSSKQPRLSELLGGNDWAKVTRRTVYGWYR